MVMSPGGRNHPKEEPQSNALLRTTLPSLGAVVVQISPGDIGPPGACASSRVAGARWWGPANRDKPTVGKTLIVATLE